ncbi:hypothetical protein [Frankia sp. KB5]|uniref:hypothetical protein n=1 Tax=Frankia sp. KB5 TaxID=683318 RepID=UPI000A21BAA2|nr:hypothetical protein [Frankia sp. KB5]ORT53459.1 hypothetical protein KBI5_06970 [Frankia sp. KB5]
MTAGAPDQPVGARCEPAAVVGSGLPLWAATSRGRAVRGAVLALLTVGLAAVAHSGSGRAVPDPLVTVVGFLLTWRVGWGLAVRQISRRRLIGLVVAAQGCLHLAFAMASPPGPHSAAGVGAGHVLARHHPESVPGPTGVDLLHGGPTVLGLHLLAAVCLAWWLAAGERLLWRAGLRAATATRRIVRRVRRRLAAPPLPACGPRPMFFLFSPAGTRRLGLLRYVVARRGPPVAAEL